MVRLRPTTSNHGFAAGRHGLCEQKFQLPDLVACKIGTSQIIPLDVQFDAKSLANASERLKRCRGAGQVEARRVGDFPATGIHQLSPIF
jgi:hypothetical protein